MTGAARTVAVLAALTLTAPVDLLIVAGARVFGRRTPPAPSSPQVARTVLVNGGKMTKSLQLARSFHAAGHRVVLVESAKYRWTAHRFSRAVDAFHVVPEASDPGYVDALVRVARAENVDVFVPVSSPASSVPDAEAGAAMGPSVDVVHADPETIRRVDDKNRFADAAREFGVRVPESHRITDAGQIAEIDLPPGRDFVLKRIAYNPVGRMDLTPLRRETPEANLAFARGLGISEDDPWILQEFVTGREYCTHGTVRNGSLQVYGCCESSAFQINYAMVDKPDILDWVETFVAKLGVTGQFSFDFIENGDGEVFAIECNPRTHSAITMFHDHPDVAAAYLGSERDVITPLPSSRPTYWLYHEVWRLLTEPRRLSRLRTIARGRDAVLTGWDPWPWFLLHHLHVPSLLLANLRSGRGWSRIDFNIGKLVEQGGD